MNRKKWRKRLVARVCSTCISEAKGRVSGFSYRWSAPDRNSSSSWVLQIAPETLELVESGPNDGSGFFHPLNIDLLRLPLALAETDTLTYEPASQDQPPHILLTGCYRKREVVVRIFFEPFTDDEPRRVFDAVNKCWRKKKADE